MELLRWTQSKPAGEFTISLGGRAMMMKRPGASPVKSEDKMGLTLGNVRINVVPRPALRYGTEQYLMDLFNQVDAGKKGFITRKQVDPQAFTFLRALFDLADINGDGRLTRQELKTYLDLQKTAAGVQMSLRLVPTGQGLFQILDANGDGRLSIREMRNAWARLAEFDQDGDGCIARNELPHHFRLTVTDSPSGAAAGPVPVAANRMNAGTPAPARSTRGPLWFRKMDRNGDGDVSRKEWLGSKEDFDRIDTDGDGLISVEEAEAFDALVRKK
jgi:Ca2+-binding EF-hand superfamily protein